jgi:hypothetical protein
MSKGIAARAAVPFNISSFAEFGLHSGTVTALKGLPQATDGEKSDGKIPRDIFEKSVSEKSVSEKSVSEIIFDIISIGPLSKVRQEHCR